MISCQFALYPLGVEDLSPALEAAVAEMRELGLQVEVGPMNSQVAGDPALVFEGLQRAFEVVARDGHVVMTVTVSNACPLPTP
jgi:uncharacterized protein YqgV (UPF0045/DUF77 family)